MSRFQPRGGVQTTALYGLGGPINPTPADLAFAVQQQTGFDQNNAFISNIAFFLPNGNPNGQKTDAVQTLLLGVQIFTTVASLTAAGLSSQGVQCYAGLVDQQATLAARKA